MTLDVSDGESEMDKKNDEILLRQFLIDLWDDDQVDQFVVLIHWFFHGDFESVDRLLSELFVRDFSMFQNSLPISWYHFAWTIERKHHSSITNLVQQLTRIQSVSSLVFFESCLFSIFRTSISALMYHSWTWEYSLRNFRKCRSRLSNWFFEVET